MCIASEQKIRRLSSPFFSQDIRFSRALFCIIACVFSLSLSQHTLQFSSFPHNISPIYIAVSLSWDTILQVQCQIFELREQASSSKQKMSFLAGILRSGKKKKKKTAAQIKAEEEKREREKNEKLARIAKRTFERGVREFIHNHFTFFIFFNYVNSITRIYHTRSKTINARTQAPEEAKNPTRYLFFFSSPKYLFLLCVDVSLSISRSNATTKTQ